MLSFLDLEPRACLKIVFSQLCVTIRGIFGSNERGVMNYVK